MATFTYTPTRETVGGSTGIISCNLVRLERSQRKHGKTHTSLSGATESVLHRLETEWQFTTQPFELADLAYWREMVASLANGETVTVDVSDIAGGPASAFAATLKENSFQESRHNHFWFQVSFTMVQA